MAKGSKTGRFSRLRAQALSGDRAAWNVFLDSAHAMLMRDLAARRPALVQRALVEDAVQEGLLRIALHLHEVTSDSEAGLIRWILVVGRHAAVDLLRSTVEGYATVGLLDEHDRPPEEGREHHPPVPPAPELLDEVLRSLSEPDHRLLWLRLVQGDSWAQVGEEMGISSNAARVRYQRLRKRLEKKVRARVDGLEEPGRTAVRVLLGLEDEAP